MSLLESLGSGLASATPRRIILDAAFMSALRSALAWERSHSPTLGDLHPSLGNFDAASRLINKLRFSHYSEGTGFEGKSFHLTDNGGSLLTHYTGVLALQKQQSLLSADQFYIRCVETHEIPKGTCSIIICMFPAMSMLLLKTRHPSIDTSFKRVHGWQEFEIEAWFQDTAHCECKPQLLRRSNTKE